MTDEEMAEEYTDSYGFGSDCNNLTSYEANREVKQAYLAGLKADVHTDNSKVIAELKNEVLRLTDEEMAEEYVKEEVPFDTTESGEKLYTEYDLKQAYLAGLKAGRPKWHKVADGDLPELYKDVLVVFPRGDCSVKLLTNKNEWVGRGSWCSLTDAIAWCEIPEYTEE